jgi:hypothetical protein
VIMKTLFAALLALSVNAHADEMFSPMSSADQYHQVAITGLLLIDRAQTVESFRNQDKWHEDNQMIRRHFSEPGIRNYFALSALGSAAITKTLPADWRPAYQYSFIAYQVAHVVKNKRIGMSIRF